MITQPAVPESRRDRIQRAAVEVARRYRVLGHDAPREGAAAFYLMLDLITFFDLCHASRNMASSTLIFSTVAEVEQADNDSLRKMRARCVRHFWIHHVPRVPELKRVKARHPNLARR